MTNNSSSSGADGYTALAQQFISQWQQQMSGCMQNEQFIRAMLDAMQHMPQNMGNGFSQASASGVNKAHDSAAAKSDGDGNAATAELEQRVAACEARIAFLESQLMGKK